MPILPDPVIDDNGDYVLPVHPKTAHEIKNGSKSKAPPRAVWYEPVQTKSGKKFTVSRTGIIISYNAIYRTIIMEIDGVPSAVPWDETQTLTRMNYKIYIAGGIY